jgi:hypothetical protein
MDQRAGCHNEVAFLFHCPRGHLRF